MPTSLTELLVTLGLVTVVSALLVLPQLCFSKATVIERGMKAYRPVTRAIETLDF